MTQPQPSPQAPAPTPAPPPTGWFGGVRTWVLGQLRALTIASVISIVGGLYGCWQKQRSAEGEARRAADLAFEGALDRMDLNDANPPIQIRAIDSLASIVTRDTARTRLLRERLAYLVERRTRLRQAGPLPCGAADTPPAEGPPDAAVRALRVVGRLPAGAGAAPLRFARTDLRGAPLDSLALRGASFAGACLAHASLAGADLTGARLEGAQLDSAVLHGAVLDSARVVRASLRWAVLTEARSQGGDFRKAVLTGAALDGVRFTGAALSGATLRCATLEGATLEGVRWSDADLSWSWFAHARVRAPAGWDEVRAATSAYLHGAEALPEGIDAWARERGAHLERLTPFEWRERRRAAQRADPDCGEP